MESTSISDLSLRSEILVDSRVDLTTNIDHNILKQIRRHTGADLLLTSANNGERRLIAIAGTRVQVKKTVTVLETMLDQGDIAVNKMAEWQSNINNHLLPPHTPFRLGKPQGLEFLDAETDDELMTPTSTPSNFDFRKGVGRFIFVPPRPPTVCFAKCIYQV